MAVVLMLTGKLEECSREDATDTISIVLIKLLNDVVGRTDSSSEVDGLADTIFVVIDVGNNMGLVVNSDVGENTTIVLELDGTCGLILRENILVAVGDAKELIDVSNKPTVVDSILIAGPDSTGTVVVTAMEQSERFTLSTDNSSPVSFRFDVTRSIN